MSKRKTTEEFIEDAKKVHGDKYHYDKVEYWNSATKVCIICNCGNEFFQSPNGHLRGDGCPICGAKNRIESHRLSTEEFVRRAKKSHGNRYDYSSVDYNFNKKSVDIICKMHGVFSQRADIHIQGHGCPVCALEKISASNSNTQDDFLKRSKIVHGDKYDYSNVVYTKADVEVKIVCPVHGEFLQTSHLHMRGHGCRLCYNESITGENSPLYKHGRSAEIFSERDSSESRKWAKTVKTGVKRCGCCGTKFYKGLSKHAHHLNSWIDNPEQRYDPNNGVCICEECHNAFHSLYGRGQNTEEQYIQFKKGQLLK